MFVRLCCVRPLFPSNAPHDLPALRSTVVTRFITTTADSAIQLSLFQRLACIACAARYSVRGKWTSQVQSYIFAKLADACDPGVWRFRDFVSLTLYHLLLAVFLTTSARPPLPFGVKCVHPFGFRLECFTVYASTLSLPPGLQDSLRGGADFSFRSGTYTRKIHAAFLGALGNAKLITAFGY